MAYYTGRVTISSGTNLFAIGFVPTWATFRVAGKDGTTDSVTHFSLGSADGTRQNCGSMYMDTTGGQSFDSNTKVVSHYERVSGTITEVLNGVFTGFSSTGGGSIGISSTATNLNYKVTINCGN